MQALDSDIQDVYWYNNTYDQFMLEDWEIVQYLTLCDSHYF